MYLKYPTTISYQIKRDAMPPTKYTKEYVKKIEKFYYAHGEKKTTEEFGFSRAFLAQLRNKHGIVPRMVKQYLGEIKK